MIDQPSVGASGAIMALIGAYLVFFPRNEVLIAFWLLCTFTPIEWIPGYVIALAYLLIDFLYIAFNSLGMSTGVGAIAHAVGFSVGFLSAIALLITKRVRMESYEQSIVDLLTKK